ncbi:tetratricopeptide repeat protein 19, mitochondrial isoform X1 [Amblyraja radiata]|uniref:tetratricopeptide repeat protein 19, mitochondrial isoform X1 n=1 Tax=Amblyraja radiata TaxID=386614 RepID=UPI001401DAE4|nr:tetratricopeptide repeat protein 19, mitochondrial isoform X1 [Amblyraja radiata]
MLRVVGIRGLGPGRWISAALRRPGPGHSRPPPPSPAWQRALTRPTVRPRSGAAEAQRAAAAALLAALGIFQRGEKPTEAEDQIILLIKHAKLSAIKGELEDAERFLHQALHLAQQSQHNQAITYIYCQMANLAFLRGDLLSAEKLFKASMSQLLGSGAQQDDNALIEMSLKLCSIYASTERHYLAVEGYKWCIETLEEKIRREKATPEEGLSAEEMENMQLLLGMSLDSCARYMLIRGQLLLATGMYERALAIAQDVHGETHPQTVVLMNDLATVLEWRDNHQQAHKLAKRASSLAREMAHPDLPAILSNEAAIHVHTGNYTEARQLYKEALEEANAQGNERLIERIREAMEELDARTHSSRDKGEERQ